MRARLCLAACGAVFALAAPIAHAAPVLTDVGTFTQPTYVTSPPNDERLFVTEKTGKIKIVDKGVTLATPFLDLGSSGADAIATASERGVLSIAFSPDYTNNGLFYVYLSRKSDGAIDIAEFKRTSDPNVADPASRRDLVVIPHTRAANHNGGQLQFGPDGLLYFATGDGGNGYDSPNPAAQDPNSQLGKLLRVDPKTATTTTLASGLRNPFRFSFDGNDLWIGDVGQDQQEEVDRIAVDQVSGANFGWPCFEGSIRTPDPNNPKACSDDAANALMGSASYKQPIFTQTHAAGWKGVIGGYVVHDDGLPTLSGRYLFGDLNQGKLTSMKTDGSDVRTETFGIGGLDSFGVDACKRVYVVSISGKVQQLADPAATTTTCDIGIPKPTVTPTPNPTATPGGTPTPAPTVPAKPKDTTKPTLTLTVKNLRSLITNGLLHARIRASEPCVVRLSVQVTGVNGRPNVGLFAGNDKSRTATVKLTLSARRQLAKQLRDKRVKSIKIALSYSATDQAGNVTRERKAITLKKA